MNAKSVPSIPTDPASPKMVHALLDHLTMAGAGLGSDIAHRHLRMMARSLGYTIDDEYRAEHYLPFPLDTVTFSSLIIDWYQRLGGDLRSAPGSGQTIRFLLHQHPWTQENAQPTADALLLCLIGALAARHFKYGRVTLATPDAAPRGVTLYLTPPAPGEVADGEEFTESPVDAAPHELARWGDLSGMREHTTHLYRRQMELTEQLRQLVTSGRDAAEHVCAFSRLKQEFLSNVSHELRTPITTIQGYLSLLEQEVLGPLTADQAEAIRIAQRNINRLNRLVGNLLDFSSVTQGQLPLTCRPVEMTGVLTKATQRMLTAAQQKAISLRSHLAEELGTVHGDKEKLSDIIEHLLENAIKFSEHGQQVLITAYRQGPNVIIMISDHGIGMTSEQVRQAFTPFVQGDSGLTRRYGGLGMGLSLIQNLVALHGGDISIHSEHGNGTTVLLSLPVLEGGSELGDRT